MQSKRPQSLPHISLGWYGRKASFPGNSVAIPPVKRYCFITCSVAASLKLTSSIMQDVLGDR